MIDLIPTEMTDAAMWALIVGFFSPVALKFIVNQSWTQQTKAIVAFLFSAVVGSVTAVIAGAYQGLGIISTVLLTTVVAITAYQNFWRQIGMTNRGQSVDEEIPPHA